MPDEEPINEEGQPAAATTWQKDQAVEERSEEPMLYCPVCDQKLISRRCKLQCERCGYFMSCADYY
jgi:hypothetical protein